MTRVSRKRLLNLNDFEDKLSNNDNHLACFRSAIENARAELQLYHKAGLSSHEILIANSWVTDRLVTRAWTLLATRNLPYKRSALLAVGGYGRCELQPYSDIDLLIVYRTSANAVEQEFSEQFIRFLWDIGLQVGHSVRTLTECVSQAKLDVTVLTNMMEARFLCGNTEISNVLQKRIGPTELWPVRKYFTAKRDEQIQRHHHYNDTAYNLEPHLKEGPGGLRDIQTISWIAQRHFGSRDLRALVEHNFLSEHECRMLVRGRNFLWRVRNALHFISRRCEDRLLFNYQKEIALEFGYQDDVHSLAIEKFMKRYYRTVKSLRFLNDLLLQYFHQEILSYNKKITVNINRRFCSINGLIGTRNSKIFDQQPFALLEIFTLLQQRPELTGIQASTIRQIWSSRSLVDASFRKDIRCRSLFMEMLRSPSGQLQSLRRMNDYGILGAYIPVFGRIVGQMQHDLFHFFTVDAHLLFVVRNLRRLEIPQYSHELPFPSSIMQSIFKRHRLFIAALFHDIAKGRGGDHSKLGEKEAYSFCRLHDLSDYDSKFVAWLVRQHLLMSWVAQRQDISDPDVITNFARNVGNQERLDNLYLLTVSDMRGTSPYVWNDWKGQLLMDLYLATSHALQRGVDEPIDLRDRVKDARLETASLLPNDPDAIKAANRYWDTLAADYFLRYRPEIIAWHTQILLSTPITDLPLVSGRLQAESKTAQFLICSPRSDELLSYVTKGFDNEGMNIIDARVHMISSGLVLMIFVVLQNSNTSLDEKELLSCSARIRSQLLNPSLASSTTPQRLAHKIKHFPIKTLVDFRSAPERGSTIMELTAQDRPGLLHQVANVLINCKVRLVTARVTTFGEKVEDVFLIQQLNGGEIKSKAQRERLAREIRKALS
ncbi:MAG: [protein-PII] uridylyltransferase [Acidiferrobacteraceae bacterium]|nr:[protein-PII] uridylyltransferase [Acidiferrobacteraceae bacterium]